MAEMRTAGLSTIGLEEYVDCPVCFRQRYREWRSSRLFSGAILQVVSIPRRTFLFKGCCENVGDLVIGTFRLSVIRLYPLYHFMGASLTLLVSDSEWTGMFGLSQTWNGLHFIPCIALELLAPRLFARYSLILQPSNVLSGRH